MQLLRLLLKKGGYKFHLATGMSIITGLSTAGLIALINLIISDPSPSKQTLIVKFVGLSLLLGVSMAFSQALIARLVQTMTLELQTHLSQEILDCSLRHLEELGVSKLLATLTGDVEIISQASYFMSTIVVAFAMLLSCMFYLSYLSPLLFVLIVAFLVVGIISQLAIVSRGKAFLDRLEINKIHCLYIFG